MKLRPWPILGACALAILLSADTFALEGWLRTRDDGLKAAQKSGKPVLVITLWGDGV